MASKLEVYLYKQLRERLFDCEIKVGYWPDWFDDDYGRPLELDFYLPALNIAIEVQGLQHFEFIPYFHQTEDNFKAQQYRDHVKRAICFRRKVELIEVDSELTVDAAVARIVRIWNDPATEKPYFERKRKRRQRHAQRGSKLRPYLIKANDSDECFKVNSTFFFSALQLGRISLLHDRVGLVSPEFSVLRARRSKTVRFVRKSENVKKSPFITV